MDRIEKAIDKIPGYPEHRDREQRREANKEIRSASADHLYEAVDNLTAFAADLASERELSSLSRVDGLRDDVRTLADRIRTASYGYAGIDPDDRITATGLDKLRDFDLQFREEVEELVNEINALIATTPPDGDHLRNVANRVRDLNHRLNDRKHAAK